MHKIGTKSAKTWVIAPMVDRDEHLALETTRVSGKLESG